MNKKKRKTFNCLIFKVKKPEASSLRGVKGIPSLAPGFGFVSVLVLPRITEIISFLKPIVNT